MPQLENIEAIEKRLWNTADTLRANSNYASNEYFLPVMGLIFLRHAYSRYLTVKDEIEASLPTRGGKVHSLTKEDFSQKSSIFLQQKAQFDHLVSLTDRDDRARAIGIIERSDLPWEWLRLVGNDPPAAIHEMVTDVINKNAREIMKLPAGSREYQLKHDPDIDKLVVAVKDFFKKRVYTGVSKSINVKNIIEGLFNFCYKEPKLGEKLSPFGTAIRLTGFPPKQLAGHIIASLTDEEARKAFKKIS